MFFLIDGSYIGYRSWHSNKNMMIGDKHVGAIYGFLKSMGIIWDYRITHGIVLFDKSRKSFRTDIFPKYKAHRPESPKELKEQWPAIVNMCEYLGWKTLSMDNVEADDVIASYVYKIHATTDLPITIITLDKDLTQCLISHRVAMRDIYGKIVQIEDVEEKFGVRPNQMVDFLALMGDSSDGIPGIPRIGKKKASALLRQYGSINNIINTVPCPLEGYQDDLILYKKLTQLKCDLELPYEIDELKLPNKPYINKRIMEKFV
jgi:DNA polymerase I